MMYFAGCKNIEEVEHRYKQWAKVLHSDTGGNDKEFQDMQLEYANIKAGKTEQRAKKKPEVKQTSAKQKAQPEEMLMFAGNILTLVKTGLELAKEINTYIETEKELSDKKNNEC